ncbi:hypothetical protein Tsubulata_034312 [Turnera subulata]|uniref:DUF4283 domain-containing protein n=1 Tax=Turnera subulata TaxID=218843 RepID=A0A9Q0FH34_9ROSI|nr:hypothetical protein Tsubulata_034312 [Turnera subulata]
MVVPVLSSSTIIDSTGVPCTKSTTILDLARIEGLLQSNSARHSLNRARMSLTPSSRTKLLHLLLWVTIWVNLNQVTETKSLIQPLDFIPTIIAPGSSAIKIPNDVLELGRKKYKLCLVGQFMGKAPRLGLIHAIFNKLWGREGSIITVPYKEDLFLIQFPTESSLSRALYGGPWHVGGVPLHLRLWDSKFIGISCSMVVPVLSSSTIIDSTGAPCTKSTTILDLARIEGLLQSNSARPSLNRARMSLTPSSRTKLLHLLLWVTIWVNLNQVTETKSLIQPLDFIPTIIAPGSSAIKIPNDVLELGRKKYKLCLVGQFMGKAPRLGLIHAIFNKLWGREGSIITVPYKEDLFLIQFPTESSLSRALYGGPWHVGGVPLHLRLWDSKTWEGLSILGSAIGKPLHMDQDCTRLLKPDRINLCIEVDFS